MDAYSSYIIQTSNARLTELRREAAEYALSRSARATLRSWWSRLGAMLPNTRLRRRPAAVEPVTTVMLPLDEA